MKVLYLNELSQPTLINNPNFTSGGNKERTRSAATNSKCIFKVVNIKVEKNK
jgi:hypothetical protein